MDIPKTKSRKNKKKKKSIGILLPLMLVILLCVGGLVFVGIKIVPSQDHEVKVHKYALEIPEEFDSENKLEVPQNGGGAVVTCGTDAVIDLKERIVEYYYSNSSRSPSAVRLQLYMQDEMIATSGMIYPGYRTYQLDLVKRLQLKEGTYDGVLKILFYDSQTNEKANVDGEIDIVITVNN